MILVAWDFRERDARAVLPKILDQLQLKRTMASKVDLEDGSVLERVGAEIPPSFIETWLLEYTAAQALQYRRLTDHDRKNLNAGAECSRRRHYQSTKPTRLERSFFRLEVSTYQRKD